MSVLPAMRMLPSADLARAMSAEGLRLMFPLAALHAALWPFLWVGSGLSICPLQLRLFPATGTPRKCWSAPLEARF